MSKQRWSRGDYVLVQSGAMFRPAFGVVERMLLRRFCSRTAAAGSQSKLAGARLLHQHSRSHVGAAAATTSGHNFGSFVRNHKPQAIAIVAWSVISVGIGYMSMNLRPSEIDWVEAGVVSPVVRKQNRCGCCWAMAAIASVGALHYLNTKQSITLSVQELIDCDPTSHGCEGGNHWRALNYILENRISTESSYPYMARNSTGGCKLNKTAAAGISNSSFVDPTEDALEEAVAKHPVIVTLQSTDDLQSYKGGIMETLPDGSAVPLHSVLIVGYGTTDNGVEYWRFKNSWGKTWGEGGFRRIRRHVADERGVLGMFMSSPVYPVLNM